MTDKFAAAQRIAGLMPRDIRALDDAATLKLVDDLWVAGIKPYNSMPKTSPRFIRDTLSTPRHWAHCLTTANSILRGESTGGPCHTCPQITTENPHTAPGRRVPARNLHDHSQRV